MYLIKNTEQNNQIASEYETKSLLYLLSMRKDSEVIDSFLIDCFNDVSGCNEEVDKIWDIQSKGVKSLRPKTIGSSLFTLYKNFKSSIQFDFYILFLPKIKEGYLKNETLKVYKIDNFLPKMIDKIKLGLNEEYKRREKLEDDVYPNEEELDEFLSNIEFVVAEESKEKYIKNIIKFKKEKVKNKEFFNVIFDEIQNKQTILKNICIEGIQINKASDILAYNKLIRKIDIESLVINRLVGTEIFNNEGIRPYFVSEIIGMEEEDIKDLIQECNSQISRTLFNKNTKQPFWVLLEYIIKLLKENPKKKLNNIYDDIPNTIKKNLYTLDEIGIKYFISILKDGVINVHNK
ncbi:hypothetical protein [Clostridium intestinale]|uniref:CD-NTase associated protein 4-like DNA endonuclease domain-containing protein n=1 Tax=Clostridium intestinale URNW TaxID=1294142 RepID=U2MYN0_9CLOT|nr:hypothetical protein [Clostridium intestinale]ERK28357.1 hypothetical protein CINTURNW_4562 [Clostridium intestinale URNW]